MCWFRLKDEVCAAANESACLLRPQHATLRCYVVCVSQYVPMFDSSQACRLAGLMRQTKIETQKQQKASILMFTLEKISPILFVMKQLRSKREIERKERERERSGKTWGEGGIFFSPSDG